MDKIVKITIWNANGLARHSQEIKTFVLNQDIDILCVSETHFRNKNTSRIPGYTLHYIMYLMVKPMEELLLS